MQTKLQDSIEKAFTTALRGGEPQWNSIVRSYGLTPLNSEQRLAIRRAGVAKLKGVLPVELRVVLEEIRVRIAREPGAAELSDELATFVERELVRYVAAAQPPRAIFASLNRAPGRNGGGNEPVDAFKCSCCGSDRPADADQQTCAFCGAKLS